MLFAKITLFDETTLIPSAKLCIVQLLTTALFEPETFIPVELPKPLIVVPLQSRVTLAVAIFIPFPEQPVKLSLTLRVLELVRLSPQLQGIEPPQSAA